MVDAHAEIRSFHVAGGGRSEFRPAGRRLAAVDRQRRDVLVAARYALRVLAGARFRRPRGQGGAFTGAAGGQPDLNAPPRAPGRVRHVTRERAGCMRISPSSVCHGAPFWYDSGMREVVPTEKRHRTTVNLPISLLRAAEEEIGSTSATETITTALSEMVARRRRGRLLRVDLPDLMPSGVEKLREPRLTRPDA